MYTGLSIITVSQFYSEFTCFKMYSSFNKTTWTKDEFSLQGSLKYPGQFCHSISVLRLAQ